MEFLGQCAVLGTASVADLIDETDPLKILAIRAANAAASRQLGQIQDAQAEKIAIAVGKLLGAK